MASVFSYDLRIQNASDFKSLVERQIGNNRIYFAFGRAVAWPNDAAPIQANTSMSNYNDMWKRMIGAKLLTGNEVKHVIPRINWEANTKYQTYDDCLCNNKLFNPNSKFYILTTDWNVYKCLDNSSNANSTIMPTQVYTDKAIEEADGYVWKYMYTIPSEDRIRFTTNSYIPVKFLSESDGSLQWQVQSNAVSRAIESTIITNPGSGYSNANTITVSVVGDGSGANAIARINTQSNTISSIVMTSKGSNYTFANVIINDTGTGTNAAARAVLSPVGGHGSNPLNELGGSYLILNPRLQRDENNKFPITNEYRQLSLIVNPREKLDSNLASKVAYSQFITATLDSGGATYEKDETVYQGSTLATSTFSGTVLDWDSANSQIKIINSRGTLTSDILIGANTLSTRFVQSFSDKELKEYTGTMIYINNIEPIERASDQIEDFKIVLSF